MTLYRRTSAGRIAMTQEEEAAFLASLEPPVEAPAARDARKTATVDAKTPEMLAIADALGLSVTPTQVRQNLRAIEDRKP